MASTGLFDSNTLYKGGGKSYSVRSCSYIYNKSTRNCPVGLVLSTVLSNTVRSLRQTETKQTKSRECVELLQTLGVISHEMKPTLGEWDCLCATQTAWNQLRTLLSTQPPPPPCPSLYQTCRFVTVFLLFRVMIIVVLQKCYKPACIIHGNHMPTCRLGKLLTPHS